MASANTLCKKLLNVKNTVIECKCQVFLGKIFDFRWLLDPWCHFH